MMKNLTREERNHLLAGFGHTPGLMQDCCFISPDGDCFPVAFETHGDFASDLLEVYDYYSGDVSDTEILTGWMTVSHGYHPTRQMWHHRFEGDPRTPTVAQANTLQQLAELDPDTEFAEWVFRMLRYWRGL